MAGTAQIGIGLVSFAHLHQRPWADVFAEREEARVVAVWDADADRADREAARLGVEAHGSLGDLLARSDVDAVSICSENAHHGDQAVAALAAGRHVLLQKPMAATVGDADRILAAANDSGAIFMQAYNLRFDALHLEVRRLLDDGAIGRVHTVRRRHSHHFAIDRADREDVLGWMTDPVLAGGGALMDEGAHALLWFLWMFGMPRAVTAWMADGTPGLAVEDSAHLLLDLGDGCTGSLQTGWTEVAGGPTIEIYGDGGTILATGTDVATSRNPAPGTPPLQVYRNATGTWEFPEVELPASRATLPPNAFVDCLLAGGPSPVPAGQARDAVAIAAAAYESARTGRTVPLG